MTPNLAAVRQAKWHPRWKCPAQGNPTVSYEVVTFAEDRRLWT